MNFKEGEAWKKVFGPVFIYLNSFSKGVDPLLLWHEAKNQVSHTSTHIFMCICKNKRAEQ